MESDLGKLFIGGISWDTDEERLKDYFRKYGEVVEAVIMRDRATGRARGFGFVVFADPAVAERVIMDKHIIDGRTVEAKKAVPKDDQHILNRTPGSVHGSPGPGRTKKIFVGGLASTVTESDFKKYFDQFGAITDVVVMYDHNTQRPRGFGFITYDSEDAVDRVLLKQFHELNGKMVEVKRAVPKELSPGSSRSPIVGYNYNLSRANSFLNNYVQGYNMSPVGGYGVRMDGRFNQVASGRSGFSPFGTTGYGMSLNLEPGLSPSYGGNSNFGNSLGYARMLSPYYSGNSNRYSTPIGYSGGNGRNDSLLSSTNRNVWGNGGLNNAVNSSSPGAYLNSGSGGFGVFGNSSANWGPSPGSAQGGGSPPGYTSGNIGYGSGDNSFVNTERGQPMTITLTQEERAQHPVTHQQRVIIENYHGEKLVGILHDTGSKELVIVCHGFQSWKERIPMVNLAAALEKEGISAFRFDFAGNGESEGSFHYGNYRREADDLRAVIQHFRMEKRVITAITGHSKGGNVVLLYASKFNDVPIVVNMSGRFNLERGIEGRLGKEFLQRIKETGFIDVWNKRGKFEYRVTEESLMDRLSTDTHAACISIHPDGRVLTVHGSMDRIVPVEDAMEFAKFIPNHKLHIIEGADHEYTSFQDELASVVVDFVRTHSHQDRDMSEQLSSCTRVDGSIQSRL